jgi:hypothetical protein
VDTLLSPLAQDYRKRLAFKATAALQMPESSPVNLY